MSVLLSFCRKQLGSEFFPDPDEVGRSEYRAIYDLLNDAVQESIDQDDSAAETLMMIDSVLGEFEEWAGSLRETFECVRAMRSSG